MSVKNESAATGESVVLERPDAGGVYASLFEKINLSPVAGLSALDTWQDSQAMADATASERLTAGMASPRISTTRCMTCSPRPACCPTPGRVTSTAC